MECDNEDSRVSTPDKVPMSETFKTVLDQLKLNNNNHLDDLDCLDGLARLKQKGSKSYEDSSVCASTSPPPPSRRRASVCVGQITSTKLPLDSRHRRRKSVQWIDEHFVVPLAHEPRSEEKHGARLFMKTVPKSILKSSHENIFSAHSKTCFSEDS